MTAVQRCAVYDAKVVGEIAKQVYTKERMNFPSGQQFSEAQQYVKKDLFNASTWKNLTKQDVAKGAVVAAELYTFFLIGEVVGRRNLIGYKVEEPGAHHAEKMEL